MRYVVAGALALAFALTLGWQGRERGGFEDEVVRAAFAEEARRMDTPCPLNGRAVDEAEPWVLAACASGGLGWHEAARKYGADAEKVFLVYGSDPDFAGLFERIGHPVVPVIAYFVRNGSTQYLLQETVGQGLSRLWNEGSLGFGVADLTPEQYGLVAIHELRRRGHEMLSEFEIVDGVAVRKPFARTVLGAKNLVLGGITDLEAVIARGERLPGWSEVGWAAFDVAIVAGGIGAAAKSLRLARAPAVAAGRGAVTMRVARLQVAGRGAARSLATVGKAAGVAAAIAIPYVAVTRPHLVATAGGWLAEQVGLPAWLGVFTVYAVLCLALFLLLRLVLAPLIWTTRTVGRVAGAGYRLVS